MNAQDILTLKPKEASILFPGDTDAVKRGYRELAKLWHPDRNKQALAREVFSHLTMLKDAALRSASGQGAQSLKTKIFLKEGMALKGGYRFKYLAETATDLGSVWVGKTSLAYDFPDAFDDLAGEERRRLSSFNFADAAMEKEIKRFLPKQKAYWDLGHNGLVSVIERPAGYVLLSDLWAHYDGKIPAVHVAWIVSSLLNVACYLRWSNLCHGAISMANVLVSPKGHSVILAGGWGFATAFGKRPAALPSATTSIVPSLETSGVTVDEKVDLRLIRSMALELLGSHGRFTEEDVPRPMRMWLLLPPKEDAYADYASWIACLDESFGARRFVEMNEPPPTFTANNRREKMGMGRWNSNAWDNYAANNVKGKSQRQVFTSRNMKSAYDPREIKVREARDSADNPNSTPIILASDVTGSMGMIAHNLMNDGLNKLATEIYQRKPVTDPQIMVMAIGDAKTDSAPAQATQFEADISLADQVRELWIEGNGGGNGGESYSLAHYFAATRTATDAWEKRRKKGYIFTIGDEPIHDGLTMSEISKVFGDTVQSSLSAQQCLEMAARTYEVFHVVLVNEGYALGQAASVLKSWQSILPQRVLQLDDYTKLAEVIVSTIQVIEGENKAAVAKSWSGSTAVSVAKAIENLPAKNMQRGVVRFAS